MTTIIGLDPGLCHTGWGIIQHIGNRMQFMAAGTISPPTHKPMGTRLAALFTGLNEVFENHQIDTVAVEKTFVNCNPRDALTLGQARGIVMMTPANHGLEVHEYATNKIKKTVTGAGHANKEQIAFMIKRLLPTAQINSADAADALATAICHASFRKREFKHSF